MRRIVQWQTNVGEATDPVAFDAPPLAGGLGSAYAHAMLPGPDISSLVVAG